MRTLGALPDDIYLDSNGLRDKVRAILISHAHLDHIGAVPYVAPRYKAPVVSTPFTIAVTKTLLDDNNHVITNRLIPVEMNQSYTVKGKNRSYKVEFINMTHSTIQSSIIAVHTPDGVVLYGNDYKLDNSPVFGDKPNYKRLKELAKVGIKALIVDCLYAPMIEKLHLKRLQRTS